MQHICKFVDVSLLSCNFCLYNISQLDIIDSPTEINVNYNLVADNNSLSSDIIGTPIKINFNYRRFADDVFHIKFSSFFIYFSSGALSLDCSFRKFRLVNSTR